jgi:hypothetical protein
LFPFGHGLSLTTFNVRFCAHSLMPAAIAALYSAHTTVTSNRHNQRTVPSLASVTAIMRTKVLQFSCSFDATSLAITCIVYNTGDASSIFERCFSVAIFGSCGLTLV